MNFLQFNPTRVVTLTIATVMGCSVAAAANQVKPPRWDIAHICGQQALKGPCPRTESDARRAVLDKWNAVPTTDRKHCMSKFDIDGKRSYRDLSTCINEQAFKSFQAQEGA